jgi:hypothetical protein
VPFEKFLCVIYQSSLRRRPHNEHHFTRINMQIRPFFLSTLHNTSFLRDFSFVFFLPYISLQRSSRLLRNFIRCAFRSYLIVFRLSLNCLLNSSSRLLLFSSSSSLFFLGKKGGTHPLVNGRKIVTFRFRESAVARFSVFLCVGRYAYPRLGGRSGGMNQNEDVQLGSFSYGNYLVVHLEAYY